jgi:competence protein ComEC
MERLRSAVHRAIDRHLPADEAAIVRAFATGDRARIKRSVNADFAASGLSHLLAVSGLNLAIVAGLFIVSLVALFKAIPGLALSIGARRLAAVAALPFVVLYTMLVGASPSSVRAAVMIASLLASYLLLRGREAWSALSLAVLVMLAWDPGVLQDLSFQLSFAAVASLLLLYPAMRARFSAPIQRLPRLCRWPADVALASAAATLGTLPLVAWHFQRISIVGLAANVPAAPLSSIVLVPLSLLGGLMGTLSDTLAHPILAIAGFTSKGLVGLAHAASTLPGGSFRIFSPNAYECLLLSSGTVLVTISGRRSRALRIGVACLVALAVELGASAALRKLDARLTAAILPVGQGDGIVLELPFGRVIAIDTGPPAASAEGRSAAERVILPYLRHRRIGAIDRLILTHPHADHTGGLSALAREVTVKEIWWTNDQREGPPDLRAALAATGARLAVVTATLAPETVDGVTLEVLAPRGRAADHPIVNDGSIVVSVRYGDRALLFTGDAEGASEDAMLAASGPRLRSDVLKAGHHGSKTSTGEAFLAAVDPAHAIISDGRLNRFGFPHRAVLERLEARGTTIWRTDQDGAIFVETDGRDLRVRSFRQRH